MKDDKIIEQLKLGNHSVFKYIYNHYGIIEHYILKNSGNKEDAKDTFQNALIIFYKKALSSNFELTAKISTYLFAIAQNLWLKNLRDTKNNSVPLNEYHVELEAPTQEAEEPTLALKDYIKQKLLALGEPCLSLIMMHSYQKLSMEVISEKMGYANEHTTRQQKYKCLKRIRKMIPEEDKNRYLNV